MTRQRASGEGRFGRVVLADRNLPLLAGVHSLLAELFDSVLMVADEGSLLDAADTYHPDLAVVDLSLPREGEVDVVRRLMGRHADLPVLVLSVHDEPLVADELIGAGAKGFVLKRALPGDLKAAVEEIQGGGVFVSPSVHAGTGGAKPLSR